MATKKKTALDTLYFVNGSNKNVTLEAITGDVGQKSRMSIDLDGKEIAKNHDGSFPETVLGSNKDLLAQTLTIVCTIADTSRNTNFTELRLRLKGGIIFQEYPLFAEVENEGDSVKYICIITFFKP
jgi:hypothetical protein